MDDNSITNWLRPEGLKSMIQSFDSKTTAPQYTILVFASFLQIEDFRRVLQDFCSVKVVDRCTWSKRGYNPGVASDHKINK
mmetsp:Transcript_40276/g.67524  ORF Transcript_40276/g.67524 Transcript_40276/m.67524 type:complete len:81 (-) Transcript_40276:135-377(-)